MDTGKTTSCKVVESALSGSAQHRPCPNKYQQFPRKLHFEAQDHIQQTLFNLQITPYCAVIALTCAFHLIVFVDRVKPQLQRATNVYCCPFPYTFPWNVHTVFPVPTNSTHLIPIFARRDGRNVVQ